MWPVALFDCCLCLEIPVAIVTAIATIAAVQEGHFIRTGKVAKCA